MIVMWRSFAHLLLSVLLSIVTVSLFVSVIDGMTTGNPDVRSWLRGLVGLFGETLAFYMIGTFVFMAYFGFLQWRYFRNLDRIGLSIRYISEGHFDHTVQVAERSPFGGLAKDMNVLVERLKNSLDDERRAEQTKNELITNVSHDLRTPLTSVLGYLGLIEQDRYRDEVELRHYVQIAYDKSQRLHVLINDLFEYTRMRHDAVPLQRMNMNLTEMLGQLLVQFLPQLKQSGMEGKLHSEEKEVLLSGDPAKLVRVFENLLTNAVTYGKEGRKVDIRLRKEKSVAIVEVANYGEMIPAVDLPFLFDRFYRVDKSRTEKSGGSGLGLAIAKGIVERHGGEISAASDHYETVFKVRLPIIET
ncbi:GHKL domain-containing protein [Paenibacillus sp. NEAU-GSW1]|nr:GHKL domain-containing protein [Paenibacillus sp. NEAU-GSW1]